MSFWEKVIVELTYKNISRKELAGFIGVPVDRINRSIERNSVPSALDAYKISKVLKIPLEELLGIKDTKSDEQSDSKNQIFLYRKYAKLIDALESFPQEKQKLLEESFQAVMKAAK